MNKYRMCTVAVSRFQPALLVWLTSLALAGLAQANPVNPSVAAGSASFSQSGKQLTITNTPGTVINWQGFSIAAGETTRFVQQSSASQVLNRVTDGNPSQILGSLLSNGKVFLINPNGIVFGVGSQVNVASLVASTLAISDQSFLNGRWQFQSVGNAGVNNQGVLLASAGSIVLLGSSVQSSGQIQASGGQVQLLAGKTVSLLDINNPELSYDVQPAVNQVLNSGQIMAGNVALLAGQIANSGQINASAVQTGTGGKILLLAAGDITVGGQLQADAAVNGNGGQIKVFVTHTHLDHICMLPLLVDSVFTLRQSPMVVHASQHAIAHMQRHLFNWQIWPDFGTLPHPQDPILKFEPIEPGQGLGLGNGCRIEVIPSVHTVPTQGYRVATPQGALVYTGDTSVNPALWQTLNQMPDLQHLIIETALDDDEEALATVSRHLCPALLQGELAQLQSACQVWITHLKPAAEHKIRQQLQTGFTRPLQILTAGQLIDF